MKKFILLVFTLFCANVLSAQTTLYLRLAPNIWTDGTAARFTVHYWGPDGSGWADMTNVVARYYEATVPEGNWTHFLFVRMRADNLVNDWGSQRLHQTADFAFSSENNLFTVTSWGGFENDAHNNRAGGNWGRI